MRLCCFNLRVDFDGEAEENKWKNRLPRICSQLRAINADLYGFQELKLHQFKDIVEFLRGYDYEYLPRDGSEAEGTPIFYRKDRFELLGNGSYYLNSHPDTPGTDWDAEWPRVASYVYLKDKKTGKTFSYFNSHLDNTGEVARQEGIKLMINRMKQNVGAMLLSGDFNTNENTPTYKIATSLLNDLKYKATDSMSGNTFHGYGRIPFDASKDPIDYIMGSKEIDVKRYKIYAKKEESGYASDHYAIYVDFEIKD